MTIGHVDSGKSTTVGHFLYLSGAFDRRSLDKLEMEARERGKDSFKFAWIMDTLKAERDRGLTINNSYRRLWTRKYDSTVIDTPGHIDFTKNMLNGASQADVALLVVSAMRGEFECGLDREIGGTYVHSLLTFSMGVKQMICCVNKMDDSSVNYSEARFNEVKTEVSIILKKIGYNPDKVPFIPISGWTGENLLDKSAKMLWWKGMTLLRAWDDVIPPRRPVDKPLRIPLQDSFKIGGVGTVIVGRVETGILRPDTRITIAPPMITTSVCSMERHDHPLEEAHPGDCVGFRIQGITHTEVHRGDVVGDQTSPPSAVDKFYAQVIILNRPRICVGYTPIIDCHTAHIPCKFVELKAKIDRRTGQTIEDTPKTIKTGDSAVVCLAPIKPFCVESLQTFLL